MLVCSDDKLDELKKQKGKPFWYDGFCENLSDETVLNTNAPLQLELKNLSKISLQTWGFGCHLMWEDMQPCMARWYVNGYFCEAIRGEDHVSKYSKTNSCKETLWDEKG